MRASVSSDEIASARISCSERSLKFLATAFSLTRILFFPQRRIGVAEGEAVAEEAEVAEVIGVVEGAGVAEAIGVADSVTPVRIWCTAAETVGAAEEVAVAGAPGVADGAGVAEETGVAEGAGVAATRTVVPVVRESDGLTITLSDSVTPPRISDCTPKSRPVLTSRSSTTPFASTTATCRFFPRKISVLSGRMSSFPKTPGGRRTVA